VFFNDIDVGLWPIIIINEGMPIGGIRTKQGSQVRVIVVAELQGGEAWGR
jgi:hypothetical protein